MFLLAQDELLWKMVVDTSMNIMQLEQNNPSAECFIMQTGYLALFTRREGNPSARGLLYLPCKRSARDNSPTRDNFPSLSSVMRDQ